MGGAQTKADVNSSTAIVSNYMQSFTSSCVEDSTVSNILTVDGNGNVITGVKLSNIGSNSTNCSAYNPQATTFANTVQNQITNTVNSLSQELTQPLDNSGTSATTNVVAAMVTNVTQQEIFNCATNSNSLNLISIIGNANTLSSDVLSNNISVSETCSMSSGQTANGINTVANTISQSAQYTSENLFQPLVDMLDVMFADAMIAIVVCFLLFIFIVIMYKILKHHKANKITKMNS